MLGSLRIIASVLIALVVATAGTAQAATLPFHASTKQGVFLHVTDIHFDPFADKALVPKLIKAPVARWERIFQSSKKTPFSRRGQADTSYPLFISMLSAASNARDSRGKRVRYDYVLNTGDNLAHKFDKMFHEAGGKDADYQAFVIKTLRFVDRMLKKTFPGAPLIYALGNNDAVCGDYKVAPKSEMLAALARDLPVVAHNARARRDFASGGYYVVRHPTVPRHDMIVLNSVFWSTEYEDCHQKSGDPGAMELAWLKRTLAHEKAAGRTVTLAMHIPPGIDAYQSSKTVCQKPGTSFWRDNATTGFRALVTEYRHVFRASYAGHTHMDDFRLLSDKDGTPLVATRITPAVTPLFGNNPAFAVLLYNRTNAIVADSTIVYLANADTAGPTVPAKWRREYDFARTYGVKSYTPATVAALAKRIAGDSRAAQSYMKFYPADAPTPVNQKNLIGYACAQTALTPAAYAACSCPGGAPQPGQK